MIGATEILMLALAYAIPLLILAFVVRWAVSSGIRDAMGVRNSTSRGDGLSAAEILDRRYANGELTREEYLAIRSDITREQNA